MKEKIAIIGASYLQKPLVEKAIQMGIETHCFAWEDGAVCKDIADFFYPISILDSEAILKVCRELSINGITTIATDMAVPTINHIATELNLTGNSNNSAAIATNKYSMRNAFKRAGVNCPEFYILKGDDIDQKFNFPVIVKPVDRSGSRGVTKVESYESLQQAVSTAIAESFADSAIVEEFIDGVEVSVEAISWNGVHHIIAITDKITTGEPHFVELAHHQPSLVRSAVSERLVAQTLKALDALDIKFGASHSEFKITSNGEVYIIETGARMGGDFIGSHLVQLSTGYDFLRATINVALGRFETPELPLKKSSGVYFLCEETRALMPYFINSNAFDVEKSIVSQNLKNIKSSNDRSGYLIYQSEQRIDLN